ncbi:hypothetical protein B0H14DRAFT_3160821 [Mycena olivaceomarginata]|nr:hypothetical protein B0H14DRAFT_3160821 [Mycena olivaceomarginata]
MQKRRPVHGQCASRVERAGGGMFGRHGRRAERGHTKKCGTVKSGGRTHRQTASRLMVVSVRVAAEVRPVMAEQGGGTCIQQTRQAVTRYAVASLRQLGPGHISNVNKYNYAKKNEGNAVLQRSLPISDQRIERGNEIPTTGSAAKAKRAHTRNLKNGWGSGQLEDQEGYDRINPPDICGIDVCRSRRDKEPQPQERGTKRISTSNQIFLRPAVHGPVLRVRREIEKALGLEMNPTLRGCRGCEARWSTNSRSFRDISDIERLKLQSEVHYYEQEIGNNRGG